MKKMGLILIIAVLLIAVLSIPLLPAGEMQQQKVSMVGKSPHDFMNQLSNGGKEITIPVLYQFCGIPMVLVESDGTNLIHYSTDAMNKRLKELSKKGQLILSNEVTKDYGLKCLKKPGDSPSLDDSTVPEDGPAQQWSA